MGNLFSGHFTHSQPPIRRRTSSRHVSRHPIASSSTVTGFHQRTTTNYQRSTSASSFSEPSQDFSSSTVTNSQAQLLKRKPSLKMTLKKACAQATATANGFTDEKRQLIQYSWQEIAMKYGKLQTSIKIFKRLFYDFPVIRSMFHLPADEYHLDDCQSFIRHAQVFINVLDLAVRNIFELESEVGPVFIMVGRRHFHKDRVDFRNEYLSAFGQCIWDVIYGCMSESFVMNPLTVPAWTMFISYLMRKIKEGYDLEGMQMKK